jgi:hypothetical protein
MGVHLKNELPVVQKAYDAAKELVSRAARFPREHKFTLGDRIVDEVVTLLTCLVQAGYGADRVTHLREASHRLDRLRVLLRLSRDLGPMSDKGYEYTTIMLHDLGKQIGGWLRQAEAKSG